MDYSSKTPDELQVILGKQLKTLRIAQHWTQRQLAAKAGLSLGAVANIERGEGSSVETLVRILQAAKAAPWLETLAPRPQVSPLALLRSPKPAQRVRRRSGEPLAS